MFRGIGGYAFFACLFLFSGLGLSGVDRGFSSGHPSAISSQTLAWAEDFNQQQSESENKATYKSSNISTAKAPSGGQNSSTVAKTQATSKLTEPKNNTPYSLSSSLADQHLRALGYSPASLKSSGITALANAGSVPRRCATGTRGTKYIEGMAIKTYVRYTPCPDGGSPLYDDYKPAGYRCVVVYNGYSGSALAVLAHEMGHCLYFTRGAGTGFDNAYSKIRKSSAFNKLSNHQQNEIFADDFMICQHGLDTGYGSGSYYSIYGVSRPSSSTCSKIRTLVSSYLL